MQKCHLRIKTLERNWPQAIILPPNVQRVRIAAERGSGVSHLASFNLEDLQNGQGFQDDSGWINQPYSPLWLQGARANVTFDLEVRHLLASEAPMNRGGTSLAYSYDHNGVSTSVTIANDATNSGTEDWMNLTNANTPDSALSHAYVDISDTGSAEVSKYLKLTDWSIGIPSTATVEEIWFHVRKARISGSSTYDHRVKLVKAGSPVATSYAQNVNWPSPSPDPPFPGVFPLVSYGGDLWGTSWTPAEINATGFGAAIAATLESSGTARAAVQNAILQVNWRI